MESLLEPQLSPSYDLKLSDRTGDPASHPWLSSCSLPPHYDDDQSEVPAYHCSVSIVGDFLCKQELHRIHCPAKVRNWHRVQAELRGTLLILRRLGKHPSIRRYTLQAGDAGLAIDYYRRSNVLRIRVEGHQLLLAAAYPSVVTEWVNQLHAAIAVSLPLDDRDETRYSTFIMPAKVNLPPPTLLDRMRRSMREDYVAPPWLRRTRSTDDQQDARTPQSCLVLASPSEIASNSDFANDPSVDMGHGARQSSPGHASPCAPSKASRAQSHCALAPNPNLLESFNAPSPARLTGLPMIEDPAPHFGASDKCETRTILEVRAPDPRAQLDYTRQCTRILLYNAPWKDARYVRDGKMVLIPSQALLFPRAVLVAPNRPTAPHIQSAVEPLVEGLSTQL